jgi:glucose dehydrogenase
MGFWAELVWDFGLDFWNAVQRRGVHVFPPEIGSRDG